MQATKAATQQTSPEMEDEDAAWALELEEELALEDKTEVGESAPMEDEGADSTTNVVAVGAKQASPAERRSVAGDLPLEVLVLIISFGQVGRICKSWSLASIALGRRRFSSRLSEILRPLTPSAALIALDVEAELHSCYGQSFSLTKAYGHKARQLLFNLKDSRNSALRNRLLSGELPAHTLVRMSATDMANPQLVRQRREWIKKRTHEVMRDERELEGFESDLFECRMCGSSRTRYRQWRRKAVVDRTRIIVICLRCPYRWEL